MVIVGGGIAGLTAAHKLSQDPTCEVQVLEKSPRAGGSLRSERRDGFLLEWGPHSLIDTFPGLTTLLEVLGLVPRLIRADPTAHRRFIVRDGKPREVPSSPTKLLTTDLIPLAARMRALSEPLIPRRKTTEDDTALLGGARAPEIVDQSDAQIVEQAIRALEPLIGPKGAPKLAHVVRHARAIPQYTLGHAARLAAIERHRRHLPSLTLIGHSYRGVGVGAAVEDALKAV